MHTIAAKGCELFNRNQEFVLATLISSRGSTPRTAGTQMIISADGTGYGTIGGGILEARVMSEAAGVLSGNRARIIDMELTQGAAAMDMICGGHAEVLLSPVKPCKTIAVVFTRWRQALTKGEDCLFLIVIKESGTRVEKADHCLMSAEGALVGHCCLPTAVLEHVTRTLGQLSGTHVTTLGRTRVVVIPARKPKKLYIFGAGHVSKPTAHLAAQVGFRVVVLDDRTAFASREHFPEAHEVRVLADFENAFASVAADSDTFVVIVTRGHVYDQTVLRQALETDAAYIGMIGSRRKRDLIFATLRQQGVSETDIGRVFSPIGLDIGAQTPAEIAVSIVAELIRVRAERTE